MPSGDTFRQKVLRYQQTAQYVLNRLATRAAPSGTYAVTCRPQERCHSNCQPRRRQTRILRELIARDIRECARYGRRIDGETAKLEIQADRANVEGRRDLIVDDVVDLKLAVVDVAQHQVGRACCV